MACRGVHFALTQEQERSLLAVRDDAELLDVIQENIERAWDEVHLAESDKSWDAIHRCLSDGTLDPQAGVYPLNRVVLGGRALYHGDDYIACLIEAREVKDAAEALAAISQGELRTRYDRIDPDDYDGELGNDDFEGTWEWFQSIVQLFVKAAAEGRSVLFTADQ